MSQRRRPIFQRVSKLLKISILRRPIIPRLKLIPIKQRRSKRVKLLQQHNYKFLQEYQFSPSSTSFIKCYGKSIQISRSGLKRIYGLLFLSQCIGRYNENDDTITQSWMEMEPFHYALGVASPAREHLQPFDYFSEDDSIDLKAERFIEKFYDEMRMQAREFAWLTKCQVLLITFWIWDSFLLVLVFFYTWLVLLIVSTSYLRSWRLSYFALFEYLILSIYNLKFYHFLDLIL